MDHGRPPRPADRHRTRDEDVHRAIADHKAAEWLEYNTVVSEWEREKYLQLW